MTTKRRIAILLSLIMLIVGVTGIPAAASDHHGSEHHDSETHHVNYSDQDLCNWALHHYEQNYGYTPKCVEVDGYEGNVIIIHLYDIVSDHTATLDWYYIDRETGHGYNFFDEAVDLSVDPYCPFTDVPSSKWYYSSISFVYQRSLMNGTGNRCFEPETGLSRAMFVTILGRMAGINQDKYSGSSFKDVKTGQWYSAYVEWARQCGITQGIGDGCFGLNDKVTREQMATFISRYVNSSSWKLSKADQVTSYFADAGSISSYAKQGVELMRTSGVIKGNENGYFLPQNAATRAEAATIFMRLKESLYREFI